MGCKSSKEPNHMIRVVQSAGPNSRKGRIAPSSDTNLKRSRFASNPDIFSASRVKDTSSDEERDSLFGSESRHSSAGSKGSKRSDDSGFDANENMWEHIITEESDPNLVQEIEKDFEEHELDLCVTGMSVKQIKSERELERQEERQILASLQQEGLILRPESRAAGGVSFEITEETDGFIRRPPRLEKLEKKRRKKKNRELTAEEIKQKLERAEERRKRKEQERIERINATHRKEHDDVLCALEAFQEHQRRTEEDVLKRQGSASEKREQRLKEMRDKLKAKREHEDIVRQRRKLAREQGLYIGESDSNEYSNVMESREYANEDET